MGGPTLFLHWRNFRCFGLPRLLCPSLSQRSSSHPPFVMDGACRFCNLSGTSDRRPWPSLALPVHAASIQVALADVDGRLDSSRVLGLCFSGSGRQRACVAGFGHSDSLPAALGGRGCRHDHRTPPCQLHGSSNWCNGNSRLDREPKRAACPFLNVRTGRSSGHPGTGRFP